MRHFILFFLVGCGGCGAVENPAMDASLETTTSSDASPEAEAGCSPRNGMCIDYYNHVCGDVGLPEKCFNGTWTCADGGVWVEPGMCWCSGLLFHTPDCTCEPSGWVCPDAGKDGASD